MSYATTLVACGDDEGGPSSGGSGGLGGTGGEGGSPTTGPSGGGPSCSDTQVEVLPVPGGWTSVALAAGAVDSLPDCPNSFTDVYSGLQGTPTVSCSCACTPPLASNCGVEISQWNTDTTCGIAPDATQTLASGDCVQPTHTGPGGSWRWNQTTPPAVLCDTAPAAVLSELSWDYSARMCEVFPQPVGDHQCVELPPDYQAPLCVWNVGDLACPENYPDKQVADSVLDDTRGCTSDDCSCAAGSGACAGTVTFYVLAACFETNGKITPAENTCEAPSAEHESVGWEAMPTGSCDASGTSDPTGDVSTDETVTICCAR